SGRDPAEPVWPATQPGSEFFGAVLRTVPSSGQRGRHLGGWPSAWRDRTGTQDRSAEARRGDDRIDEPGAGGPDEHLRPVPRAHRTKTCPVLLLRSLHAAIRRTPKG